MASLFLVAPIFPPFGRTTKPPDPELLPGIPGAEEKTAFGFPMFVDSKQDLMRQWDLEATPPRSAERATGIEETVWSWIKWQDPTGASWSREGSIIAEEIDGLLRYPNALRWGWDNFEVENSVLGHSVPVAIVYGTSDTQIFAASPNRTLPTTADGHIANQPGPPFSVQ